ncbi:hypothetical protein D9M70_542170 [compost metagenome]
MTVAPLAKQFEQAAHVFFIHPIQHETVGRVDTQLLSFGLDLQGTDPGVELLSRQLIAEKLHALLPKFHGHE